MISVTKEFKWDMAHMLADHQGLCSNLHGHTYKMQVEIARLDGSIINNIGLDKEGNEHCSPDHGMVIDFSNVSKVINKMIVEPLDHCFMYWQHTTDEIEAVVADTLLKAKKKVFAVPYRPTAENMALDIFETIKNSLEESAPHLQVLSVVIYETPTSYAKVTR